MLTTRTIRQIAQRCLSLILITVALLALGSTTSADQPNRSGRSLSAPAAEPITGITSSVIDCLTADGGTEIEYTLSGAAENTCPSSGTVHLTWQGQVERARLVLSVSQIGISTPPQAAHTILVNGQPAAVAPVVDARDRVDLGAPEYHYLEYSPALIVQGDNQTQLTGDALSGDRWTANHVRLQLFGQFESIAQTNPPAADPDIPELDDGKQTADLPTTATEQLVTFKNPYDQTNQQAMIQIPTGYNAGTATPLLLYAHGRTGEMQYGIDYLGDAANAQGWLLAAPDMHGSWDVPAQCYVNPESCSFDDRTLVTKPGAYAHASLESQYDIIGLAQYMNSHYNIDHSRIYLAGGSMGGQIATVTAAKFPHMFAAVYAYKSITNLTQWYYELSSAFDQMTLEKECHIGGALKDPTQNPFCYQRRSSTYFDRNYIHLPISMTHSVRDGLVPISHSRNLRDGINGFDPTIRSVLHEDKTANWKCNPPYHCIEPSPPAILDYLAPFSRNNNPDYIRIATDESKAFYWMNLIQTGGDHWSYVDVTRDPNSPTVQVWTNDTSALRVGLNLGTGMLRDYVTRQPGLGFPAATYLIKGAGHNELVEYYTGYLTTRVETTGPSTFSISAIEVTVDADPAVVSNQQPHLSTITISVGDQSAQANPVPDGTTVQLATTEGSFPNGRRSINVTTANGQATTTLTVQPTDDLAEITATVGQASGTASVDIVHTGIGIDLTTTSPTTYAGVPVPLEYRVTNEGDSILDSIIVTDDNGSGGHVTVCQIASLAPKASTTCPRDISLSRTTTITALTTGLPPAGDPVSASDSIQITVIAPSIGLTSTPNPHIVYAGESTNLTYRVTNTGDTVLKQVSVKDDNGNGGNVTVCSGRTLQPGATTACTRSIQTNAPMGTTITYVATATGQDNLNNPVTISTQATIIVGGRVFLPYAVYNR